MFNDHDKGWKILMVISLAVMLACSAYLGFKLITTGEIMPRDIELSGGKQITVQVDTSLSSTQIMASLSQKGFDTEVRLLTGIKTTALIDTGINTSASDLISAMQSIPGLTLIGEPNVMEIGPQLSEQFFQQTQMAVVVAFAFMAILVFILFRTFVPSIAVILSAYTDIIVTMTIMSLLNVQLSLPLIAGLLMLIGYSVDTDILQTSRVTKRLDESLKERFKGSVKTGMTMTMTTLVALLALYFLSGNATLQTIAFVLLVGLVVDWPSTWITNSGILRLYMLRKAKKEGA